MTYRLLNCRTLRISIVHSRYDIEKWQCFTLKRFSDHQLSRAEINNSCYPFSTAREKKMKKSAFIFVMALTSTIFAAKDPIKLIKPTTEKRLDYLAQAKIWENTDIEKSDLFVGPSSELNLKHNSVIDCDFEAPGKTAYNGFSLKFRCNLNGTHVKVKYLKDSKANREVFSEVAATRLFWSLGFLADRVYPVEVRCHGCPEDPFHGSGDVATRLYPFATIERKHEGVEIEETENQGWSFQELEDSQGVLGTTLTERQIHGEALKLLAVFIQHGDRKAEQQRLSCPLASLEVTEESQSCHDPEMLIQDLGATFGGAGAMSNGVTAKMNLAHWTAESVFNEEKYKRTFDQRRGNGLCEGNIKISMRAGKKGMGNPIILEEGRAFLADLLQRFQSAGKVEQLFQVANVQGLGDQASAWAQVFNQKVSEVLSHRCCRADAEKKNCLN
jgi:hypothetical protein